MGTALAARATSVLPPLAAGGAAAVAGALIGLRPSTAAVAIALFVAAALVALAVQRPAAAFVGVTATLALIPVYAAPLVGNFTVNLTAAGLWLVIAAVTVTQLRHGVGLRPTPIDWAVLLFFALLLVPVLASTQTPSSYVALWLLWLGPYLAARLVLVNPARVELFVRGLAVAALVTVPFALFERVSGTNLFFMVASNYKEADRWAHGSTRLGAERVAAAFGHPIAYSMFLAAVTLLCLAAGVQTRTPRRRWWLLAAAVLFAVQALTLSRTGWTMLAAGLFLVALVQLGAGAKRRLALILATAVGLGAVAFAFAPVERQVVSAVATGGGPESLTRTRAHRQWLLSHATRPGVLELTGQPESHFNRSVLTPTGYRTERASVDNAYLSLANKQGLVVLVGFLLVVLSVMWTFLGTFRRSPLAVICAVTLVIFVGLWFVALITQQQIFVWLMIGASAAVGQLVRGGAAIRPAGAESRRSPPEAASGLGRAM